MAEDSDKVVAVTSQEGDRVAVSGVAASVPLAGFPPGFKLRAGDNVFLVQGEKGPEAWPLTRAREVPSAPQRKGQTLTAGSEEFALQDSTVDAEAPDSRTTIFTVPNEGGRPEQVLSVRSPRH